MVDRIEAAAIALWLEASHRQWKWDEIGDKAQELWRKSARVALAAADTTAWQPIETAPRDRPIDVWLGRPEDDDMIGFYCLDGTRRSCQWMLQTDVPGRHLLRPIGGLGGPCSVVPTHWRDIPPPPKGNPDG